MDETCNPPNNRDTYRVIGVMPDGERISISKYVYREMAERIAVRPEHRAQFKEIEIVPDQPQYEAHMDVYLEDGTKFHEDTAIVLGHAENPMSEEDFRGKFEGLVVPVLGAAKTARLYALLNDFGRAGNLAQVMSLLEGDASKKSAR